MLKAGTESRVQILISFNFKGAIKLIKLANIEQNLNEMVADNRFSLDDSLQYFSLIKTLIGGKR